MIQCPTCFKPNPDGTRVCQHCHSAIPDWLWQGSLDFPEERPQSQTRDKTNSNPPPIGAMPRGSDAARAVAKGINLKIGCLGLVGLFFLVVIIIVLAGGGGPR